MKKLNFPIFKTRNDGRAFDLNDPKERKAYFELKAGPEIKKIQKYLADGNTFVAFLLGKKNSGKGTYSKLFMEAIGSDAIGHLSVGDIVRDIHKNLENKASKSELITFLEKNYRGFHTPDETIDLIMGRNQTSLISSELIVALIEFELSKRPKQAIFLDGFPRALDQISYSIYLKRLIGYRDDPDFLIFIDVPEAVIDQRIKARVICPICKTPRSLKLAITKEIGYDEEKKEFYLMCDNPSCNKARMVPKEGDELGIEPIRERLELDDKIFAQLLNLHGIPKIYLRNSIPEDSSKEFVDAYEISPSYAFKKEPDGKIQTIETPWVVNDDDGIPAVSLLPAPVTVAMIKQIATVLGL
jgi:adenylate kinase family enzyme